MVNVTIGNGQPLQQEKPFPKLMKHKDGTIVLFSESGAGVCIVPGGTTQQGYISHSFGMFAFTDFNEPITIQNQ